MQTYSRQPDGRHHGRNPYASYQCRFLPIRHVFTASATGPDVLCAPKSADQNGERRYPQSSAAKQQ
jgi:hypothetical protein